MYDLRYDKPASTYDNMREYDISGERWQSRRSGLIVCPLKSRFEFF